ncbi:MAG: hypothetical protein RR395_04275 [Ruthenibacterium sp.]
MTAAPDAAQNLCGKIEIVDHSDGETAFILRGITADMLAELRTKAADAGMPMASTLKLWHV